MVKKRKLIAGALATGLMTAPFIAHEQGKEKPRVAEVAPKQADDTALEAARLANSVCTRVVFNEGDTIEGRARKLAHVPADARELTKGDLQAVLSYEGILTQQLERQGITDPSAIPIGTETEVCMDPRVE